MYLIRLNERKRGKNMKKQSIENLSELVLRAQSGDSEAFSELYRQSGPTIYRTICSMVRDENLAWDIHQNTYILAYRWLNKLEKPEAFLPWLRKIAVNETIKELNKEQPLTFTELAGDREEEPQFQELRDGYQPEIELDKQEAARLVREILEKLPPKQQLILGMYYYEGYSVREIAEALHVTEGTVKTQLHLGRKRVETEVKRLEVEGVKLYGLSPMAFLAALQRTQEPSKLAAKQAMRTTLAKTAASGSEPVVLTAKAAGSGFFHSVLGKVTVGVLAAAVAAGGVFGYFALRNCRSTAMGDNRPSESVTVLVTEPALFSTEDATEPIIVTEPDSVTSEIPVESQPEAQTEKLFSWTDGFFDDSILAVICNEPFSNGSPAPTVVWNEGEQDRLVICPRYPGSTVSANRIVSNSQGEAAVEETPVYSTLCGEGDCVGASLERPEECPLWVVTVRTSDGAEGSWILFHNSRYGTLRYEFLTAGRLPADMDSEFDQTLDYETANLLMRDTGYDPEYSIKYHNENHPFLQLGESLMASILRAFDAHGEGAEPWNWGKAWMWNEWFADEGAVWTKKNAQMIGDTCSLEAVNVHEYYMNEIFSETFVEGQGSRELSIAETASWQAALFDKERLLGYAGEMAAEGEKLHFDLNWMMVFNPTLAAKTVSVTVNGQDAGTYALTEGDFFTWIPLDYQNLPGDRPVQVEARVTETRFGAPEEAILDLLPDLSSNLRGGR